MEIILDSGGQHIDDYGCPVVFKKSTYIHTNLYQEDETMNENDRIKSNWIQKQAKTCKRIQTYAKACKCIQMHKLQCIMIMIMNM